LFLLYIYFLIDPAQAPDSEVAEQLARLHLFEIDSIAQFFSGQRHLPTLRRDGSITDVSINRAHVPVKNCFVKEFGILEIPEERVKHLKNRVSNILKKSGELGYSIELDVQVHVVSLLEDMIEAAGLQNDLHLRCDLEVADLKAHIWIISVNGYPVGAVEIKKPSKKGAASTMNNSTVQGQLFDYMMRIRSFHGLRHVFGIMTDFEEWRICWLPDTDGAAGATDLTYKLDSDNIDIDAASNRVLHCTGILTGNSNETMPSLAMSLVSVLSKMNYGKKSVDVGKMCLLSNDRSYILMDKNYWFWTRLHSNDMKSIRKSMEVSLLPPGGGTRRYILLRDYHGGADGRVWLAAGASNGQLAVIKFLRRVKSRPKDDESKRMKREIDAWRACGISSVHSIPLGGRPAIIMPFSFHCNIDSSGRPSFIQSPDSWSGYPTLDKSNILFLADCQEALRGLDPCVVLRECVSRMAKAKYVHLDIEWRHVSVTPIFKRSLSSLLRKRFVGFVSTFIDFGRIKKVQSQAIAEEEMNLKMEVLISSIAV
jgi:hypothetical protein